MTMLKMAKQENLRWEQSLAEYHVDIAIMGAGLGGVAAAFAACDAGRSVALTEPAPWIGGQITSQGVSALDEHEHIEHFGGTRSYMAMRDAIRRHYQTQYGVERMPDGAPLNPGDGWVSRLCFEPRVGLQVLQDMLAPHVASGRLTILLEHEPIAAKVEDRRVISVEMRERGRSASSAPTPARFTHNISSMQPNSAICCR